jgi:hypothetical protein
MQRRTPGQNRLSSALSSVKRRQHRIMQSPGVRPAHVMTRMTGLGGFVSFGATEIGLKLRARSAYLFPAALLSEGLHDGAIRAVRGRRAWPANVLKDLVGDPEPVRRLSVSVGPRLVDAMKGEDDRIF